MVNEMRMLLIGLLLGAIFGLIFGFGITMDKLNNHWHARLIDAGVAHYELVEGGPETRFVINGEENK